MIAYIIKRLFQSIITVILVTLVVFFIMHFLPGDPILLYMSHTEIQSSSNEQMEAMRHELGLDKPLIVQYFNWLGGIFKGDLGKSIAYQESVSALISRRLPITLHLGLLSFVISTILGILAGLISALRRGKNIDLAVTVLANIGITIPIFWLGITMIYFFGLKLKWLPICGYTSPFDDFLLNTKEIILPIFCLAIFSIASIARQTRSCMLETIRQDYIRTAWSKGLSERIVVMKHVMKNGLIPVVTLVGSHLSHILGGSVLVETVFNIPGIGRLMVSSVYSLDYTVIEGIVLLMATMVVITNLVVDISYSWLDPRISYS